MLQPDRISALIAHRDGHNRVVSPGDESLRFETGMGLPVSCMRFADDLFGPNRGRTAGGHAALDGWRACRRTAAARYARIRCMDGRARSGGSETEGRSAV